MKYLSKRNYQIVIIDRNDGMVSTPTMSLYDITLNKNELEFAFAIQELCFDELLDLHIGNAMSFKPNRDSNDSVGLIVRIN